MNRLVRSRIESELRALGLAPRVDKTRGCNDGRCAEVENVVATITGRAAEPNAKALVLVCHYDSVPTGPGASDDGAGVAALIEVARALTQGDPVDRDVVLLFDDGEEQGLLGADAFLREAPEAARIGVVINVEARGTRGPSMMFESKNARLGAVSVMGRALTRPVTSSLFAGVYERMPNDTDLSVFGRAGHVGFNFAFIRGLEHYHRMSDNLAQLDLGSLQHHGDNVLAMVRAFGGRNVPLGRADGDARAVWFDLLSLVVIAWPEWLSLPLSAAVLGIGLLATKRNVSAARSALWIGAVSVLVSLIFPEGSYLLVVPGCLLSSGLAAAALAPSASQRIVDMTAFVTTFAAGAIWFEILLGLRDVLV